MLSTAQNHDPDDPLIHFYLAQLFHRRNGPDDVARAREAYQLYLDQSPQDSPFRGIARQALTQLGR